MAYENPGKSITLEAGSDLSADQFKLVVLATDGQIDVAGASHTAQPIGVLQNKPAAAGRAAEVMVSGISKAIVYEPVDEGVLVCASSTTGGRIDLADATTDVPIGIALKAGAAGDIVPVFLFGPGGYKA